MIKIEHPDIHSHLTLVRYLRIDLFNSFTSTCHPMRSGSLFWHDQVVSNNMDKYQCHVVLSSYLPTNANHNTRCNGKGNAKGCTLFGFTSTYSVKQFIHFVGSSTCYTLRGNVFILSSIDPSFLCKNLLHVK